MPKKTRKTLTISLKLAEKIQAMLGSYASLLDQEIDSSVNDQSVIVDYKKDLTALTKVENAFMGEIQENK